MTTTILVEYRMFYLCDFEVSAPEEVHALFGTNGLAAPSPGIVVVHCGVATGHVTVDAQAHTNAPPLDLDDWDDVVEVSVHYPRGQARVLTWAGEVPSGLPNLCAAGPGWYRTRVHARDRRLGGGEHETYFIQVWPQERTEPTIHRLTDEVGAANREAIANLPDPS